MLPVKSQYRSGNFTVDICVLRQLNSCHAGKPYALEPACKDYNLTVFGTSLAHYTVSVREKEKVGGRLTSFKTGGEQ